jgi:hypothetical protein
MLVKLKRNWFGPDAKRYRVRENLHQVPDEWKDLVPSDAECFDDHGIALPSRAPVPRPGYGAKPIEEQILDVVGSGTVKVTGTATTSAPPMTPEEKAEDDKKAEAAMEEFQKLRQEAEDAKENGDEQSRIDELLKKADEFAKEHKLANDPVAAAAEKQSHQPATPAKPTTPAKK